MMSAVCRGADFQFTVVCCVSLIKRTTLHQTAAMTTIPDNKLSEEKQQDVITKNGRLSENCCRIIVSVSLITQHISLIVEFRCGH